MTPAEKLGYKVGDEFEVLTGVCGFKKGQIVKLFEDDGSGCVCFEGSPCGFECADGKPGAYLCLGLVKPVERITLEPGDYIATTDLSEDDYHNVAKAFMAAGAYKGEYPDGYEYTTERAFGIDSRNNKLFHGRPGSDGDASTLRGRQLTLSQILNATNAGNNTNQPKTENNSMHLTDQLEQAIKSRNEAQADVERLQAEFDAAYPNISGAPKEDLSDPANWRAGDVVQCVKQPEEVGSPFCDGKFIVGREYAVVEVDESGAYRYGGGGLPSEYYELNVCFKFIRRP